MNKLILIIAFFPLFICSCVNELTDKVDLIDNNIWNPTFASPLVNGNFSIGDVADAVSNENLEIAYADDGTTILLYKQLSVFSQTANEVFSVSNQSFNTFIEAVETLPASGVSTTIQSKKELVFDLNSPDGDKVYEILLNEGEMNLDLKGNVPVTGEMVLTFNSLLINGNPVIITYNWSTIGTQTYNETINLKDAEIQLRSSNLKDNNKFELTVETTINYDGSSMSSTDGFQMEIKLNDLSFSKLTASFGQRDISPKTKYLRFNSTNDIGEGKYELVDPKMNFLINNTIGVPFNIDFKEITAYTNDAPPVTFNAHVLKSPIDIDYPIVSGEIKTTRIELDKDNSNLPELINYQRDSVLYTISAKVNPSINTDEHFVLDTSKLEADVQLEIPMYGAIKDLEIEQSYEFNGGNFDNIDNAILKINTMNALPFDVFVQAYFLDELNNKVDSIIQDKKHLVSAALVDTEGNVSAITEDSFEVILTKDQIERISNADKLVLYILLNTPQAMTVPVRFKQEDKLKVDIFGRTNYITEF